MQLASIDRFRPPVQLLPIFVVAILCTVLVAQLVRTSLHPSESADGLVVYGVRIGGMSRPDVYAAILRREQEYLHTPITLTWGRSSWELYPGAVGAQFDVSGIVDMAMASGRRSLLPFSFVSPKVRPPDADSSFRISYSARALDNYVDLLGSLIDQDPAPARFYWDKDGTIHTQAEQVGYRLDRDQARRVIDSSLRHPSFQRVHALDVREIKPALSLSDIAEWAPVLPISSFSTRFDATNLERSYNIARSALSISGVVLAPGQMFSFNGVVGMRTGQRGYRTADVIMSGKLVPDIGGGICQVSSTLYNAALLSGLEITERWNHSIITNYVEPGRDATVSYGYKDLRFRNSTSSPVVLRVVVTDDAVTAEIWGDPDTDTAVEITTQILEKVNPPTTYIEDPKLPKGKSVVERWGAPEYLVEVHRIVRSGGNILRDELLSKDRYASVNRVIRVGTGDSPPVDRQ